MVWFDKKGESSMEDLIWLNELKSEILMFMDDMHSQDVPGYYRYSYSGDIYDDGLHWNVGSSVFALKIYYTLDVNESGIIDSASEYIKSFMHKDGMIYDDFVYKKGRLRNFLSAIKHNNLDNLFNAQYKRAETRQCYSALLLHDQLMGVKTNVPIPGSKVDIGRYLEKLNWKQPWSAGSHFSHLMFFLMLAQKTGQIDRETFDELTEHSISWVNRLQNSHDGSWYSGSPTDRFKVNGAMKVLTGLIAVNKVNFCYPEKLVDLCLSVSNDQTACDNFNIILVLNYAGKLLGRSYRQKEIEAFALKRLAQYKKHYFQPQGGFSFFINKANSYYYGVKISKGLFEPDIHGTIMFLWGISIISQILGINEGLGFREQVT